LPALEPLVEQAFSDRIATERFEEI
jgi:hypothetical protein